jgi:hypothetical protein
MPAGSFPLGCRHRYRYRSGEPGGADLARTAPPTLNRSTPPVGPEAGTGGVVTVALVVLLVLLTILSVVVHTRLRFGDRDPPDNPPAR